MNENYFDELLQEIREIRMSERNFYQKITDIYVTSLDYNKNSSITKEFFKTVQNKIHYATHGLIAYIWHSIKKLKICFILKGLSINII